MRVRPLVAPALLLLLAILPSQAAATMYYFCYVTNTGFDQLRYYTDIMTTSVADVDERWTGKAYFDSLEEQSQQDYPGNTSGGGFCTASPHQDYIQKAHARLAVAYMGPGRKMAFTNPPIPSKPVADNGGPAPVLVIEKSGPTPEQQAATAAKAQADADRARQVARENADRAAQVAAQNAAYQAQWGDLLEKERQRRRKCASCQ